MKLDEVGWKDYSGRKYMVGDSARYNGTTLMYSGVHNVMNRYVVPIFIDNKENQYYVKQSEYPSLRPSAKNSAVVELGRRIVGFLNDVVLLGLPSTVRSIAEILRNIDVIAVSLLTAYPNRDLKEIKPDKISEYFDRFGVKPLPAESLERVTEDDGDLETKIEEWLKEFFK